MSDEADMAVAIVAEHLERGLRRISAAIPAGVPGECDNCGEDMPRLVGGLCAPCRDGRNPDFSARPDAAPRAAATPRLRPAAVPAPVPQAKETTMPAYNYCKYLSVPCDGALLKRIEHYADSVDESLAQAAVQLIQDGLNALALADAADVVRTQLKWDGSREGAIVFLGNVPNAWLAEEIARRMGDGVSQAEFDAAMARAEAAEGQFATMMEQLRGLLGEAA